MNTKAIAHTAAAVTGAIVAGYSYWRLTHPTKSEVQAYLSGLKTKIEQRLQTCTVDQKMILEVNKFVVEEYIITLNDDGVISDNALVVVLRLAKKINKMVDEI